MGMKFSLGDEISIVLSGEQGYVDAYAVYQHSPVQFYIKYKAADGRAVSGWFGAEELDML